MAAVESLRHYGVIHRSIVVHVCEGQLRDDVQGVIRQMRSFGLQLSGTMNSNVIVVVVPFRSSSRKAHDTINIAMNANTVCILLEKDFVTGCRKFEPYLRVDPARKSAARSMRDRASDRDLEDVEEEEPKSPRCPATANSTAREASLQKFVDLIRKTMTLHAFPDSLTGKRIVITGSFENFKTHKQFKDYLLMCGARTVCDKNVTGDTDFLVFGSEPYYGKNLQEFERKRGSTRGMMSEQTFLRMLQERHLKRHGRSLASAAQPSAVVEEEDGDSSSITSSPASKKRPSTSSPASKERPSTSSPASKERPSKVSKTETIDTTVNEFFKRCPLLLSHLFDKYDETGHITMSKGEKQQVAREMSKVLRKSLHSHFNARDYSDEEEIVDTMEFEDPGPSTSRAGLPDTKGSKSDSEMEEGECSDSD